MGLVAIRPPVPVTTARLAPPGYRVAEGQAVVSVGCNNGGQPTARHSQVTRLNKFQGPPNIEVAGQPAEGRSGGGLFTSEGYVIGVCNAADPTDKEGLFVALEAICAQLDQDQLAFVYKSPAGSAAGRRRGPTRRAFRRRRRRGLARRPAPPIWPLRSAGQAGGAAGGLASHEQAALDEIRRSLREGAEVVVVVRPRGNPDAQSEVIMLDHVSPEFLKQLAAEQQPHGASLRDLIQAAQEVVGVVGAAGRPAPNPALAGGR